MNNHQKDNKKYFKMIHFAVVFNFTSVLGLRPQSYDKTGLSSASILNLVLVLVLVLQLWSWS